MFYWCCFLFCHIVGVFPVSCWFYLHSCFAVSAFRVSSFWCFWHWLGKYLVFPIEHFLHSQAMLYTVFSILLILPALMFCDFWVSSSLMFLMLLTLVRKEESFSFSYVTSLTFTGNNVHTVFQLLLLVLCLVLVILDLKLLVTINKNDIQCC